MKPTFPLLLVDDEESWLNSLAFTLEYSAGINNLVLCSDSRQVMDILSRQEISVVLLDLNMPHISGDELLPKIVDEHPDIPVVILSGLNQLQTAVRCMKLGAADYVVKTEERERLLVGIQRLLSVQRLERENRQLKKELLQGRLGNADVFAEIVTRSPQMHAIFRYIEAVADSGEAILISGESGVGKELIARAVHKAGRAGRPWVAVNVAGLDDNVFSDTLFGHVRGAFTGADRGREGMIEQARGGTLFLDEIGDLHATSQVKLLRFLQEGEYFPLGSDRPRQADVQLVFATNQNLDAKMAEGTFRKDLYYRLNAHRIVVPPLRERREDIPLLIEVLLEDAARQQGKKKPTPPQELATLLSTYHFPGNVRELRAMIHDAVSLHQAGKLSMSTFRRTIESSAGTGPKTSCEKIADAVVPAIFSGLDHLPTLTEVGELLVEEALRRSDGNQSIAAGLLGISRQALNKRVRKHRN